MGEILPISETEAVSPSQIIERHRTMLRSRQLDKKPIDLHAVIDESLALLGHDMSTRTIEPTLTVLDSRCVVDGDQVLLEQVLVNLLRNAMDAMAETPPARRRSRYSARPGCRGRGLGRDTGPGLPPDLVDKLFTPFVTTKAHGIGIGLTIVRTIVDAHGGAIDARNNPEGARPSRHASPQQYAPAPAGGRGTERDTHVGDR